METMISENMVQLTETEALEKIAALRPIDAEFMQCLCASDRPFLEKTVQILMRKHDLEIDIVDRVPEQGIRMTAHDLPGNVYEIRLHCAGMVDSDEISGMPLMDTWVESFRRDELIRSPHRYAIRIAENDPFGKGWSVYPVNSMESTGEQLLYINGQYRGDSAIGCLLHDFRMCDPHRMLLWETETAVRHLKNTPEGISHMLHLPGIQALMREQHRAA